MTRRWVILLAGMSFMVAGGLATIVVFAGAVEGRHEDAGAAE